MAVSSSDHSLHNDSFSNDGNAWGCDADGCLTLDFSPNRETVGRWKRLPQCDEFVGARRSKHTMVVYHNAIYVFGGDNGKEMLNDTIRYDPTEHSWARAFTMGIVPASRYHHSAVVHDLCMYVFGGYTGDIHSNSNLTNRNDLFEYKFKTGQWSEIRCDAKLPPARSAHGAAVYNDFMYIFGGFDGHTRLNDMWRINLKSHIRKWEQVGQLGDCPPPCCNFAVTVIKDGMYLFSGQSGAKSTNYLFQFNFADFSWKRLSTDHILRGSRPAPERRYGHSMVGHNRHLYVFGGAADSIHPSELHCYDLEANEWNVVIPSDPDVAPRGSPEPGLSKPPGGRLFHSAIVVDNAMYVFGGTVDNNVRVSDMYRFCFAAYPTCTLQNDFGRLLTSRQFCDLKFIVGPGRSVSYAHVAIVAARSAFLRAKMRSSKQVPIPQEQPTIAAAVVADGSPGSSRRSTSVSEKHCEVIIPDAEPFAFELVLDYIYTDQIDPTQRGQEPSCNHVVSVMMEVYRLSMQFNMQRLEALCIQYLESMIGLKNVLSALQIATRRQLNYVKEFCLKFICKESNYNVIVMSKEFETLEQPLMVEIIRRRQIPALRPVVDSVNLAALQLNTLQLDMKSFLEDGVGAEFCDLTLMCNGQAVPVHKVILAARCGYFEAMFRSFMPETNTVTVALGQVVPSENAFRSLLRYIYYGCIQMCPEDSLFLFTAPYFYQFANNRLQVFCKENLETNIHWTNVLDILEAAERLQAQEMKKHALRLIVQHYQQIVSSLLPNLKQLSQPLLVDILVTLADQGIADIRLSSTSMASLRSNSGSGNSVDENN